MHNGIEHHHHHEHEHHHDHGDKRQELMALMKYMVGHNASHMRELRELAGQLNEVGESAAYEGILAAVADFDKGNSALSAILSDMEHKEV